MPDERDPPPRLGIEAYALIGDLHTAALVGNDGSIDWLCLPRFDSASTFGALLGDRSHGRWLLAPTGEVVATGRRYVGDTFVLETTWQTPTGTATVTDFMPLGDRRAEVIRRVTGVEGTVRMGQEWAIRFGYATAIPWVRRITDRHGTESLLAVAGPDAVLLRGGPMPRPVDHVHAGEFDVAAGERVDLSMIWYPSHRHEPARIDVDEELAQTVGWWEKWAGQSECTADYPVEVRRSLLVLRALTHEDTGGIVAAATTSLPEEFGGSRNWDYRYCWLRDASLTLEALLLHGYREEAAAWRSWLLRAIAGSPEDLQIMYGVGGERYLPERELDSLPGYDGAGPVRVGNGAYSQYQGDVLGEVMVALDVARNHGIRETEYSWPLQRALIDSVEARYDRPDHGIWEVRGKEQFFTHSRVMMWAALDRGVRAVSDHDLDGPADRWAQLRDRLGAEIEDRGYDADRRTYLQHYDGTGVDASLLQLAQVGYIGWDDERMLGTVAAIEAELMSDGLLMRYRSDSGVDGLPAGENPFLACSFWLVEQYARSGRLADARSLMDRLVGFANDVGLLSEEYDLTGSRQAGNTPQALSHLALVRAADAISAGPDPRPST